jgi:hypothetical protein
MKTFASQAQLAAAVESIFRRWPALVGFSVQEMKTLSDDRAAGERELVLTDVETSPRTELSHDLYGGIATALLRLIDDEPAIWDLVRGRTFARVLH